MTEYSESSTPDTEELDRSRRRFLLVLQTVTVGHAKKATLTMIYSCL